MPPIPVPAGDEPDDASAVPDATASATPSTPISAIPARRVPVIRPHIFSATKGSSQKNSGTPGARPLTGNSQPPRHRFSCDVFPLHSPRSVRHPPPARADVKPPGRGVKNPARPGVVATGRAVEPATRREALGGQAPNSAGIEDTMPWARTAAVPATWFSANRSVPSAGLPETMALMAVSRVETGPLRSAATAGTGSLVAPATSAANCLM